jgi:hypothetical protein
MGHLLELAPCVGHPESRDLPGKREGSTAVYRCKTVDRYPITWAAAVRFQTLGTIPPYHEDSTMIVQ